MEQNKKTGLAIALGLGLSVVGCLGLGLIAAGFSYFVDEEARKSTVGGPVALLGDAGAVGDEPAPTEEDFAHHLMASLADAGHGEFEYRKGDHTLRSDAGVVMSLTNLYGEYKATPTVERDDFVGRTARGLFPSPMEETYADAKKFLMPSVRDSVYLDLLDLRQPDNKIVRKHVAEQLTAALVYDGESSMQFVTSDHLQDWGVTAEEAWADAIANLEARDDNQRFVKVVDGVYRSPWKDNYDTARVLTAARLKRLRVKGDPVVFLPHRDVLIVTGSKDDDGLLAALDEVDQAFKLPRATTGRAWRLKGETWEPFLPPPSSAAYADLKDYADDARVVDANDQKQALDEKFEADGLDVFVGTLFRVESKQTGERFTYCVLTKTVDSLMPKADWVVFVDLDRPENAQIVGVAPWEDFRKLLGRAVQPASYPGPERFRVKGFPNAKQIKTLRPDLP
ncbi:MAG: DUF1444 family protein [Myxococcota bacterium]